MTQSEINDIFDRTISASRAVLCSKAQEYVGDTGDRLSNFKHAAHLQNLCLPAALGGMMCKHTVSVYDMIDRYQDGETFSDEKWDEKIGDSLNYLILLKAVLIEESKSKVTSVYTAHHTPNSTSTTAETLQGGIITHTGDNACSEPVEPIYRNCYHCDETDDEYECMLTALQIYPNNTCKRFKASEL